jgi:hypothetical protein
LDHAPACSQLGRPGELGSAHVAYFAREEDDECADERPDRRSSSRDQHHGMVFYCLSVEKASLSAASRGPACTGRAGGRDRLRGQPIGHLEAER